MKPKNIALQNFYDKAAKAPPEFNFLSPTALENWCKDTAVWMSSGNKVCEIGPGKGNLALRTLSLCSSPLHYLMVDISQVMLDVVKERLSLENNTLVKFQYIKADIGNQLPESLGGYDFDRVLAINVLQDVNISNSLHNIKKILKPGGLLHTTFIAKEFQDLFWKDNPYYDQVNGHWYACSCYHETEKCKPLGYHIVDTQKKPYYRLLNCLTRNDIHTFLNQAGFKVLSIEPIIYPVEFVLKRWSSKYHHMKLNEKQLQLLNEWSGYCDGWSVKAEVSNPTSP